MGKKLTENQKQEKEIKKILFKIQNLEKIHSQILVERACFRYKSMKSEKRKAEKEMEKLENKLAEIKRKLK